MYDAIHTLKMFKALYRYRSEQMMRKSTEPKSVALIGNIEAVKFTTKFDNLVIALTILEKHNVKISHVESRQSKEFEDCHDFMVVPTTQMNGLQTAIDELKKIGKCVIIVGEDIWIPKHVSDLDRYVDKVLSAGEDLEADHPGFTDAVYRKRRKYFADIALNYKHGESIPRVEYTEDEVKTWNAIYTKITALCPKHACKEFLEAVPLLQQKCGYSADNIPQLEDISNFLRDRSGFSLRPVAGLLSSTYFLAGLAFRVFHATQYIRHGYKPLYTPEANVCHELLGQVPMFADPDFAQFSQELGLPSLGASEEDVKKLTMLYWFIIKFMLCRERKDVKAYGAGILSSFGDVEYCQTDEPERRNFEPEKAAIQEHPISRFQPIYYGPDLFLRDYVSKIPRSFNVRYNPFLNRIDVIVGTKGVVTLVKKLQGVPVTNTFDTTFWIIYRRSLTNLNRNVELPVVIDTTQTAWHEKRVVVLKRFGCQHMPEEYVGSRRKNYDESIELSNKSGNGHKFGSFKQPTIIGVVITACSGVWKTSLRSDLLATDPHNIVKFLNPSTTQRTVNYRSELALVCNTVIVDLVRLRSDVNHISRKEDIWMKIEHFETVWNDIEQTMLSCANIFAGNYFSLADDSYGKTSHEILGIRGITDSKTFDFTLVQTQLWKITSVILGFEQLPDSKESTLAPDLIRVIHLRNLLLEHRQDEKEDETLFTTAWKNIKKTFGRLAYQNMIDEWKAIVFETRGKDKLFEPVNKKAKIKTEAYSVETLERTNCADGTQANSNIQRKSFLMEKLCMHVDSSNRRNNNRLNQWSTGIAGDVFVCESNDSKIFKRMRNTTPNITIVGKKGGTPVNLVENKYASSLVLTICNYLKESELNKYDVMFYCKPMHRQVILNGLVTEVKNTTIEKCTKMLIHGKDFKEIWDINVLQDIANHQRQCNTWIQEDCVKVNRDELCLHLDDKIKDVKKYHNSTDVPWKDNHIFLERVANIQKYCDQLFAFVTSSVQFSEEQKLWLEMQTEDLLNTAYKRIFQLLVTSEGNDGLCSESLTVANDDNEGNAVLVQTCDGAFEEQYHFSKQQLTECQMCIDQNIALYWCNNCRMNICSFCKMYHETVWTVMNHDVHPLHILS